MLVLTRRVGEEILIDKGRIQIKILPKRYGAITLGIHAPEGVDIDRKEIFLKKLMNPNGEEKAGNTTAEPTGIEEHLL